MGCHTPPAELSLFCGAETFPTGRVACRITGEQWQESSNVLVYFCYFQGLTFRIWKVNTTKLFTGLPATWFVQGDACNSHGTDLQHWNLNRDYGKKWEGWNRHHLNEHKGNLKKKRNLIKIVKRSTLCYILRFKALRVMVMHYSQFWTVFGLFMDFAWLKACSYVNSDSLWGAPVCDCCYH